MPALVTDVRNFGFFVDVTGLGMSGLVPLSGLSDDFYQFDATRGQLVGRRTRRVFKLGDKVEVQVAKVDTFKRQVDFKLAGTTDGRARTRCEAREAAAEAARRKESASGSLSPRPAPQGTGTKLAWAPTRRRAFAIKRFSVVFAKPPRPGALWKKTSNIQREKCMDRGSTCEISA